MVAPKSLAAGQASGAANKEICAQSVEVLAKELKAISDVTQELNKIRDRLDPWDRHIHCCRLFLALVCRQKQTSEGDVGQTSRAQLSSRISGVTNFSAGVWGRPLTECLKRREASVETNHKSCSDEETDAIENQQDLQGEL